MPVMLTKNNPPLLAKVLLHTQLLSELQLNQAINEWQKSSLQFLPYVLQYYFIPAKNMSMVCADYFYLPHRELHLDQLETLPINLIDELTIQNHFIIPLTQRSDQLELAICDPETLTLLEELQFQTQLLIQPIFVPYDQIIAAINRIFSDKGYEIITQHHEENPVDESAVTFVEQIITDAIHQNASDIHCEPMAETIRVRMRIDGILHDITHAPAWLSGAITCRIKVLAQCDIAERRLPQDGRFHFVTKDGQSRDCRLNCCPTLFGEKLVIRLLDPNKKLLSMAELGLDAQHQKIFLDALNQPQGMILVTGPTGSGKTSTLYTALQHLNNKTKNISTVEEPIEIQLAEINQVNINEKAGLNFAMVLRAFLRQDPDIIMVGEIRDQETADIAIRAAQTGHLVLSTLHTNSASDTLIRLINMNIALFNIISSVRLIVAQRLVRRLCDRCKQPQSLSDTLLEQAGFDSSSLAALHIFQSQGCQYCFGGFHGRIGVFEIMPISKALIENIFKINNSMEILQLAQSEGMQTLWQAGLSKVQQGETSLAEIYRVLGS